MRISDWSSDVCSSDLSLPVMDAGYAHAQNAATAEVTADSINAAMRATLDQARKALADIETDFEAARDDDLRLAELRNQADELAVELRGASGNLANRVAQIEARLVDLGERPAAGQPPELAAVTDERNRLLAERAEITVIVDDAANLINSATQTVGTITTLRRNQFTQTLFRHTEMSGDLFRDAGSAFLREVGNLGDSFAGWLSFIWKFTPLPLGRKS